MATNALRCRARPDEVYRILLDPYCYPRWVLGTQRVRRVDPTWPVPGSRFHHTVGVGPVRTDDSTMVVATSADRRLVLEVRFRPLGVAVVVIDLRPEGTGTLVVLCEEPTDGPAASLRGRVLDVVVRVRNGISLRRLRRLSDARRPQSVAAGSSRRTSDGSLSSRVPRYAG